MICMSSIRKFFPIIMAFLIGFGAGCYVGYNFAPTKTVTKVEKEYVQVEGKTKTQIQYIQKETKNDADVEIKNTNPTVSINDKKYTFEKLPNESVKFENGKLQVEQGYEIKIDAKSLIPKQPKWGVDIGYSNHGLVSGVRYNFNRSVSVFGMGAFRPVHGRDKFYGGGITINF